VLKTKSTEENTGELVEEMFTAGVQYGYSKSRRHPSVASYIYTTKQSGDIINLEKTASLLEKAAEFVKKMGKEGKTILLVGTKPESRETIKEMALNLELPYVIERWIGGTLSNFPEIKKRITELENYRKEMEEGGLEKYTKKERVVLAKKMERLSRYYSGLVGVKKLPSALLIIDSKKEQIAQKEAEMLGIPVIALSNSDSDIRKIDYPVVGNDATIPAIRFFTKTMTLAYKEGKKSNPNV